MERDYYHISFQEYYARTADLNPESFLNPLVRRLAPGAEILDTGCGSGRDLLWLKERGFQITGFERSPGLAELARKFSGCRIIEGDFITYDFSQFSVDAITLIGSLVHIPHAQLSPVLDNILRALRPKGHILLSLKQGKGQKTAKDGRVFYLWQDGELRQIFQQKNCDVCEFFVQSSFITAGDIWLGYVLRKEAGI